MNKKIVLIAISFLLVLMPFLGFVYSPSLPVKPNFAAIEPLALRQMAFIRFMVPKINDSNQGILDTRSHVLALLVTYQTGGALSHADQFWLYTTADVYQVPNFNIKSQASIHELLLRIDEVPTSLVLAQAANESAWGASRFAVRADNFFGQYCYVEGCGLVPLSRPEGTIYEVEKFNNVQDSIDNYLYNLNTNSNYAAFRQLRYQMRLNGKFLTGFQLVPGLQNYSILGQDYIDRIHNIIINFNLMQYDKIDAAPTL